MKVMQMNKVFFFILLMISGLATPPVFAADKMIWIDIRTPDEWSAGHLEEAINIPYKDLSSKIFEVTRDKEAVINIYGSNGRRAIIAQKTLESLGFTNVQNLGGYHELKKRGY